MRDRLARCVALVLSLGLLLSGLAANAQGPSQAYEAALAKFAGDSYNDTDAGIASVAASGNPLAERIILALQDGRLLFDSESKKIYLQQEAGPVLDAATGAPVAGAAPAGLKPVRINNRLRRSIEAALGGLTLLSPDPARRLEAAQAVFKSRDPNQLATLEAAFAKEVDPRIRRALASARAAVVLGIADTRELDKLEAIAILRERADLDARAILSALPANQPASVQRAVADAIKAI